MRGRLWIEWGSLAVALLGLGALVQPFSLGLYPLGFPVLLFGGLVYISTTFWDPLTVTPRHAFLLFVKVFLALALLVGICIALVPVLV